MIRRRRLLLGGLAVGVVAGGIAVGVADPFAHHAPAKTGVADDVDPTGLATVARKDLSSQTELSGTLGYAGSYTVVDAGSAASAAASSSTASASGSDTFTWIPAVGQVISQGQPIYDVNGIPVVLLYGSTPAYRNLSEGESGADVEELNYDLVAMGEYASGETAPTSDTFDSATKYGVEKLQDALGVTETGALTLGQVVFLPTEAEVTSLTATLGGPSQVGGTVLAATSTIPQVSIALDPAQQSEVAVGDKVSIVLPNNHSTPGMISSVGTVATTPPSASGGDSSASSPTITVLVALTYPPATATLDQAPVNVTVTTATAHAALVVPVDALLALASGGYAVEVVGTTGVHSLVSVSLGLFDDADGLVQVTSSRLTVGQRVVVPGT